MTNDTVAGFLNRLEQEARAQIERGFVSRVKDPHFNISSQDMARLFSLRGDTERAEWWEKRNFRHVMPNLAFTVLDTARVVRAEMKPSLEWEDSVSDDVFLSFCEAMAKSDGCFPKGKLIAKLYRLTGKTRNAEWWDKHPEHSLDTHRTRILVKEAREKLKAASLDQSEKEDIEFIDACGKTADAGGTFVAGDLSRLEKLAGNNAVADCLKEFSYHTPTTAAPDRIFDLVTKARNIIAGKNQLPHKDRQESWTLPDTPEQFLDACEKLALEDVKSLPKDAANNLFRLAGTDIVAFASECVMGKEEILSYVREGRKRLNLGSFKRVFPGIERFNTHLPLAASHIAYFNNEPPKVRIVAPAVKIREKTFAIAPPVTFFDLICYAVLNTPLSSEEFPAMERKFLLSDGRFCSKKEALKIAIESGQYVLTDSTKDALDFEDLWPQ